MLHRGGEGLPFYEADILPTRNLMEKLLYTMMDHKKSLPLCTITTWEDILRENDRIT